MEKSVIPARRLRFWQAELVFSVLLPLFCCPHLCPVLFPKQPRDPQKPHVYTLDSVPESVAFPGSVKAVLQPGGRWGEIWNHCHSPCPMGSGAGRLLPGGTDPASEHWHWTGTCLLSRNLDSPLTSGEWCSPISPSLGSGSCGKWWNAHENALFLDFT